MNPEVATELAFAAADCPVWVCTSSRSDSPSSRFAFAPALSFSTRFFLPPNIGPIVGGGRRPRFELLPLAEHPRAGSHGRYLARCALHRPRRVAGSTSALLEDRQRSLG